MLNCPGEREGEFATARRTPCAQLQTDGSLVPRVSRICNRLPYELQYWGKMEGFPAPVRAPQQCACNVIYLSSVWWARQDSNLRPHGCEPCTGVRPGPAGSILCLNYLLASASVQPVPLLIAVPFV